MKRFLFFLWTGFLCVTELPAQFTRYVVQLKNKAATTHSINTPSAYLSQRAIDRRTRYNIPIDSTDLPVPGSYVSQIQTIPNVTILNISRWLNAVAIQTNDPNAINAINSLPFVQASAPVAARPDPGQRKFPPGGTALSTGSRPMEVKSDFYNYGGGSFAEINLHKGEFLHNIGLRGQGMQIAMLDGGYFNYTSLDAFDSVNLNAQVISTWDFVDRNASVTEDHPHGMQCFSIIAANVPGLFIGKAPGARFHLYRTEDVFSEYPIEEFNWACGAERADSAGADIISSSLGYGYLFTDPVPDYPFSYLDGNTTMSARAADLAAKKGMLVFNAAGNSGLDYWQRITSPADGDSVVAVGSVNTAGQVAGNSSYGPSADGQVKPDVASVGVNAIVQLPNNTIGTGSGTSFACPNMAGLGTCLWQGFPGVSNMRIVRALREAGSIAQAPDNRIGYGIPDMKKAFGSLLTEFATSSASVNNCIVTLNWTSRDVSSMKYEIERKAPGDLQYTRIGELNAAAGSLLTTQTYQFTNPLTNTGAGNISYRVRQVIDTSVAGLSAVYIDTAQVSISAACTTTGTTEPGTDHAILLVVPNPAVGTTTLMIETSYAIPHMPVFIYDMKGRLVIQLTRSKTAGKAMFELPVEKLSKGKYLIKVNDDKKTIGKTGFLKL
jgi:hypothetical protein